MRKTKMGVWGVIGLCVLLAAGCGRAEGLSREAVLQQMAAPYSFTGTATMAGVSQPVRLQADKSATGLSIRLLAPETVNGLTVDFGEAGTMVTYRKLIMNLTEGDIPGQSVFLALRQVLSAVPTEDAELSQEEDLLTLSGKAGLLPYATVWSLERCALVRIQLPSLGGVISVEKFEANP